MKELETNDLGLPTRTSGLLPASSFPLTCEPFCLI
jgi:hypothetical protein